MPLHLLTGPANAQKVGELLDRHQAAVRAGREAWVVVPDAGSADRLQRELAGADVVPGQPPRNATPFSKVIAGPALETRLARRLGAGGRALGPPQRRAVALAAIDRTPLEALAPAARAGWLPADLIALHEELAATGTTLRDAAGALHGWSAASGDARGRELAALLGSQDALLRRLAAGGLRDRAALVLATVAALDGGAATGDDLHLAISGFDDLDPLQRRLVLALAHSPIDVELSLPFEQGRSAFAASLPLVAELRGVAAGEDGLGATDAATPRALQRVERTLYEPQVIAPAAGGDGDGDDSIGELCGGGPDEELALIAEEVAAELAAGCRPERIAVVVDPSAQHGPAIVAALERAGVPAQLAAVRPAAQQPSVAALLALLRAAGPDGRARDVAQWIAGPGGPAGADRLDEQLRRRGAATVSEALALWTRIGGGVLTELRMLREARAPGAAERAAAQALRERLEAAVARRSDPTPAQLLDERAAAHVLGELDGLAGFAERAAKHGTEIRLTVTGLRRLLEAITVPPGADLPGRVAVLGALGARTRHLEVLVLARAQRGSYPRAEPLQRVLAPADRAQLTDRGWPQPLRAPHADAERALGYEVVARPTRRLLVAWHAGDGDGKPAEPSPLLAELRRAAGGRLPGRTLPAGEAARRALAEDRLARLRHAAAQPRHREPEHRESALLAAEAASERGHAVRALQTASRCPAQWLVEHRLRPRPLRPDEDPLVAGLARHELLAGLVQYAIDRELPLGPAAEPALREALRAAAATGAVRAAKRGETLAERLLRERVVAEIEATIPALCGEATLRHQPQELEFSFGTARRTDPEPPADDEPGQDDARPPVVVERAGRRLMLSGRIDRIDVSRGGEVVVVDYKGANVAPYKGGSWIAERELQAGLYVLAATALLGEGHQPAGSVYQPVPGTIDNQPRGASAVDLDGRHGWKDIVDPLAWESLLDELVALAADAQQAIDAGVCRPDPAHCSAGGCRHPWLCREIER